MSQRTVVAILATLLVGFPIGFFMYAIAYSVFGPAWGYPAWALVILLSYPIVRAKIEEKAEADELRRRQLDQLR